MRRLLIIVALAALLSPGTAIGDTILDGPEYPAPNGNSFSTSAASFGADLGISGGETWSYGSIDLSGLVSLYWGPWSDDSYKLALDGATDEPEETLTLSSMSSNQAIFTGKADFQAYTWHWDGGAYVIGPLTWFDDRDTRLTITAITSTGIGDPIDPTTVDSSLTIETLFPITGDFDVNLLLEANFPYDGKNSAAWLPVTYGYDVVYETVINNGVQSSLSNGFYSEPVPEPSTALLLATGLAGLAAVGRRRSFH